jgi:CRISPR-associated exonuclease Cas4
MYTEDELLPISALQHLLFCRRQCALIHIEGLWAENYLTAQGRLLHEKTHNGETENRPGVRIVRGLRLCSRSLGLVGQADVVEFHESQTGTELAGAKGLWQPYPVEYKRGRAKPDNCDRVQLCAQAMCLEDMLQTQVPLGALFYGRPRRREQAEFTEKLRAETEDTATELHRLYESRQTPKAEYSKKCKSCSLYTVCMPKTTSVNKDIEHYLAKAREEPPV